MADELFTPTPLSQLPAYVRKYPSICEGVIAIRPMVEHMVRLYSEKKAFETPTMASCNSLKRKRTEGEVFSYELEARMKVSEGLFENILSALMIPDPQQFQWTEDCPWVTMQDIYHVMEGKTIRTSVVFGINGSISTPTHMIKESIQTVDLDARKGQMVVEVPALRIQLSKETMVENVPMATKQTFARIKYRKVFRARQYSYMLTKSWEGSTLDDAEGKQKRGEPPHFEVEVELSHPEEELIKKKEDGLAIATNLMLKVLSMFIPRYGTNISFDWVASKK